MSLVKIKENLIKLHNIVVVCAYLKTKNSPIKFIPYPIYPYPGSSLLWGSMMSMPVLCMLGHHREWRAFPGCSGCQKPYFKR